MNTLSNLIQSEIADFFAGFGGPGEPDIQSGEAQRQLTDRVLDLLRKEREAAVPVILYRERNPYNGLTTGWQELTEQECEYVKDNAGDNAEFCTLYSAPPAQPVAVPDESYPHLSELYHAQVKRLFKLAQRIKGPAFDKYAHSTSQAIDVLEAAIFGEGEEACRAAMHGSTISNSADIAIDEASQSFGNSEQLEPVSTTYKLVGEVVAWNNPTKERSVDFRWIDIDVAPGTKLYAMGKE
ncbi:hypothetical protein NVR49_21120 [Enterobacter roggenkampii]|uniref:hypothetical protein n=1 Tax=Enterobacter roggenkampii TaxID=1812935 RepID=UPI00254A86A0|nr:hypothetical protein [Enterobacter roggenkampii]MDL0009089.1 hypothetical protein [Enterobacter roggenkampii]